MTFTVIFWFTATGYKLALAKQSKSWARRILPSRHERTLFFRKPAYMDAALYLEICLNIRQTWNQRFSTAGAPSPELLLGHDRAPPHVARAIQEALRKLGFLPHIVEPTKVVQVLDVGLARPTLAGLAARLFDHYWDRPEPAQRKLCVKLISEAF